MYFSLMFFHRYFLVASQFLTLSTLNLHSTEGWNSLCFHAGQVAACCKVRPEAEEKAAQTEKQRPSKSNRAVEDPMFFLENHWEIDTISRIVIASLEYRSVPKICSDYRILSLDVRIARAAVALRHQQLDGRWFWVSCYIVLIISKCVVAISLEDLGRSWKILEAWSSHPKLAIGPIRAIGFLRFFPRSTSRILEALAVGVELLLTSHGGTTMDLSWCNNV